MAPKIPPKRLPLEEPPSASSSTEEDEELTDEEEEHQNQEQPKEPAESEPEQESEDEEEEEEQVKNDTPKPTSTTTKNPQPKPSSDSDSGSDSDTHSGQTQPSPNVSDFTIKPIASKPMNGSPKSKKPTSKPVAKRPLESKKDANESNKKKTKVAEEEKKSGGVAVNRLWSEDDEVLLLKGMIEFQSKKGIDPSSDSSEFHEYIKKLLSVEVSKNQLMDKVRRLKKKFENNAGKGEKGEDPVFSKPHEHKCFGLSKKIWGTGGGKESNEIDGNENGNGKSGSKRARKNVKVNDSLASPKENGKAVVLVEGLKGEMKDEEVDKVEDFLSMHPYLKQSLAMEIEMPFDLSMKEPVKSFMMGNMSVIGNVKAKELEKKWKNLCLDEAALYLRRVELIKDQTKLVLDAMKASED